MKRSQSASSAMMTSREAYKWLRDAGEWAAAAVAFRLFLIVPHDSRLMWAILPSAGLYAYTDGGFAGYRRKRTGFMTCRSLGPLRPDPPLS